MGFIHLLIHCLLTGTLPAGPDLTTLTRLSRISPEDRPKKYRTLPKDLFQPALEGDMEKVYYLLGMIFCTVI